ncbi:MAG: anti-sigma factor family protein [Thermoguttaceae bacterium]
MNRQELELLISEYIDGELSLQQRKEVERLLNTNNEVKRICRDYLAIRQTLQHSVVTVVKSDVPAHFAQGVLKTIERVGKPGLGNDVRNDEERNGVKNVGTNPQRVLRDVTSSRVTSSQGLSSRVPSSWTMFVAQRLRNPRLISYPLAVLGVVIFLALYYAPSSTEPVQPVSVAQSGLSDQSPVGPQMKRRHEPIAGFHAERVGDDQGLSVGPAEPITDSTSGWIADNTDHTVNSADNRADHRVDSTSLADNTGLIDNPFDHPLESFSSSALQADQLATVDWLETGKQVPEMRVRERIYAPMSDASVKRSDDVLVEQQGTIRVVCVLKEGLLGKNFFPRFFAQRNVNWTQFTDGSALSGYEIRVSARSLQEMLQMLQQETPDVRECSCESYDFSADSVNDETQMLTVRFEVKTP